MKASTITRSKTAIAGALVALVLSAGATACGTEGDDLDAVATTTTEAAPATTEATTTTTTEATTTTAAPTTAAPTTAAPTTTAPPTTAPAGHTMPDLVGRTLQEAQDAVQAASGNPIFISFSHDLLDDRNQIMDSNWKVCTQNVAPGATFDSGSNIDFGVVKLNETCP